MAGEEKSVDKTCLFSLVYFTGLPGETKKDDRNEEPLVSRRDTVFKN